MRSRMLVVPIPLRYRPAYVQSVQFRVGTVKATGAGVLVAAQFSLVRTLRHVDAGGTVRNSVLRCDWQNVRRRIESSRAI